MHPTHIEGIEMGLDEPGFAVFDVDFSPRTAYIHMVIIGRNLSPP